MIATRAASALALAFTVAVAAACSPAADPTPRAITTDESQLLAVTRFKNYDAGARSFDVQFSDAGREITLEGYVDFRTGVGYATILVGTAPTNLVTWHGDRLAIHAPGSTDIPPLPVPDLVSTTGGGYLGDGWTSGALDPSSSTLHAALALMTGLGNDRPDNPLLLQQGGALWIRTDEAYGVPVTVFSGPTGIADAGAAPAESRLRYWVAEDGLLMRVEALFGDRWLSFDLGPAKDVDLNYEFYLASAAE